MAEAHVITLPGVYRTRDGREAIVAFVDHNMAPFAARGWLVTERLGCTRQYRRDRAAWRLSDGMSAGTRAHCRGHDVVSGPHGPVPPSCRRSVPT